MPAFKKMSRDRGGGMANPQPDDAHLRVAHSIIEELMMRDFSKRQRSILDLILRLSWGCNKHEAIIPLLRDFEICGVAPTKIKTELEYLVNALVLFWDSNTNRFWFNKNYDQWKISIIRGYSKEALRNLIHINITSQKGNNVPGKKGSMFSQQQPEDGSEQPVPKPEPGFKESSIKKIIKEDIPYVEIIQHLNLKAETRYRATNTETKKTIKARWAEEYRLEDFKSVIDKKVACWMNTEQEKFLRPETLFGSKFEGYLNEKTSPLGNAHNGPLGVQQSSALGTRRNDM
jgi:uncharacterized phage protein (TIGR02220 family)